jgi:hypothetical protein
MKLYKRVFARHTSLQPLQGASALASADRCAGWQHAAKIPCYTLAIGQLLLWFAPSLTRKSITSKAPPITKHYTSNEIGTGYNKL